ncbi:MAG: ribonuclease HII [Bacteroidota bacterium]
MVPAPDLRFESALWSAGLTQLAGMDEAGRGALAGPVAVGAVILPAAADVLVQALEGVRDSKLMTPHERAQSRPRIEACALAWAVGFAEAAEIDALGIVAATRLAASRALAELAIFPEFLLTDFRLELPELDLPQAAIVRGDQCCLSIAAASVLAKTARDARLCELDACYPGYGLGRHKGYGTDLHRRAIEQLGMSGIHRRTFRTGGQGRKQRL